VLTIGALSPAELFDQNARANDRRNPFTNGAFVNDATWDYPQAVQGYLRGALASYITPRLAVRAGVPAGARSRRQPGL